MLKTQFLKIILRNNHVIPFQLNYANDHKYSLTSILPPFKVFIIIDRKHLMITKNITNDLSKCICFYMFSFHQANESRQRRWLLTSWSFTNTIRKIGVFYFYILSSLLLCFYIFIGLYKQSTFCHQEIWFTKYSMFPRAAHQ